MTIEEIKEAIKNRHQHHVNKKFLNTLFETNSDIQQLMLDGWSVLDICYHLMHNVDFIPHYCPICGSRMHVVTSNKGYGKTCSYNCAIRIAEPYKKVNRDKQRKKKSQN